MAQLRELAELVGGRVLGDSGLEIERVASIEQAAEGEITFLANPKYLPKLARTGASAVIVAPGMEERAGERTLLVCANPYLAFARIVDFLQGARREALGVMAGSNVHDGAEVDAEATVYPGCVVGRGARVGPGTTLYPGVVLYEDAVVGEGCVLHANVVVREGCRIGDRVILQPGAIIGSDGFGYAPDGQRYVKIPQVGIVELENDVEIGAATCIDRAALGVTRIRRGVKIDNLTQIGHNVVVGEDTIIVAQVGIAGSTEIGRHCTFGGQTGVVGHIKIGDNVMIGGQSGVNNSVADGEILSGSPVMPHKNWLKASMSFARLPEMRKELSLMKKQLEELEKMIKEKE